MVVKKNIPVNWFDRPFTFIELQAANPELEEGTLRMRLQKAVNFGWVDSKKGIHFTTYKPTVKNIPSIITKPLIADNKVKPSFKPFSEIEAKVQKMIFADPSLQDNKSYFYCVVDHGKMKYNKRNE
jgi:hypothetical protein